MNVASGTIVDVHVYSLRRKEARSSKFCTSHSRFFSFERAVESSCGAEIMYFIVCEQAQSHVYEHGRSVDANAAHKVIQTG